MQPLLSIIREKSPCLWQGGYRRFPCSLSSLSWRLGGSGQGLSFLEENLGSQKKQKKSKKNTRGACHRPQNSQGQSVPAGWRCRRFCNGCGCSPSCVRFCKGFALVCKCAGQSSLVVGFGPAICYRRFLYGKRFCGGYRIGYRVGNL